MSVTAHFTEQILLQKKGPSIFNFRWLILGSYFPDGWGLSKISLWFFEDITLHRDIAFGWLHSLPITAIIAAPVFYIFGRISGFSFLLSCWMHVIMDTGDTIGVKMFYPFYDQKISLNLWPWTDKNMIDDLIGYYSNPIAVSIELFCLIGALIILKKIGNGSILSGFKKLWNAQDWHSKKW